MHTLPGIAGADTTVGLGNAAGVRATWIQIVVSGTGTVRLAGPEAAVDRGIPIPAGGGQFLPWRGPMNFYGLDQIKVFVPTGATVSVAYAD